MSVLTTGSSDRDNRNTLSENFLRRMARGYAFNADSYSGMSKRWLATGVIAIPRGVMSVPPSATK